MSVYDNFKILTSHVLEIICRQMIENYDISRQGISKVVGNENYDITL